MEFANLLTLLFVVSFVIVMAFLIILFRQNQRDRKDARAALHPTMRAPTPMSPSGKPPITRSIIPPTSPTDVTTRPKPPGSLEPPTLPTDPPTITGG